ncbi:capsule assembly Wzi family protein [Spirosoma endbachense]|uniref:capsule assembly Wzi family protein n=1 Tax=Spirosoma endbachense TaxID=2666025 RepID=UPI0013918B3E|nr:capsule assembly Wzi family protein [Spirosoma endbachense]
MKTLLSIIFWAAISPLALAQIDSLTLPPRRLTIYDIEVGGLIASGSRTPFWLQANQFGIVPTNSPAGSVRVGISERFQLSTSHLNRSISYGIQAVGNAARTSAVLLPQAYVSLDLGHFSLWGGRKKEIIGLGDSTLSSGFYSWSGNALPITKLQIGTNGFTPLGFTRGLVSVHAFFAHGWFANSDSIQQSYLHQKALYVRIGRPDSRIRLTAGVLHNAQWGGHSAYLPALVAQNGQLPNSFKDYMYVLTAREGSESDSPNLTEFDRVNRVGNHLGSIDFSAEMALGQWQAMAYYQHPFEDKSGVVFVNMPDGLYGLTLKRQPTKSGGFQVRHILLEYFNTMSQSGSLTHTGSRYDGQDDYFNNYQYLDGWAQKQHVIGSPFLSRRADLRPERQNEQPSKRIWAIANNRVQMGHLGLAGTIGQGIQWQTRLSMSLNYGTYRHPFDEPVSQFSGAAWLTWPLTWLGGSELKTAIAIDQGQLYENSVGGWVSIRKTLKTTK